MKIEQLIVQQLYNTKKVTLQDIGSFYLSPDVSIPHESDKEAAMPDNAVRFEYNKRAPQDDDLIAFIVTQTRKIKPLATSDLESYSILARQFLNIGKPFPIEGLGILLKNQKGEYEFLQVHSINARLDAAPALLKEKTEEEISFSTTARDRPGNNAKGWIIFTVTLILLAAAVLYYLMNRDKKNSNLEPVVSSDTLQVNRDTAIARIDTSIVVPVGDTTTKDSAIVSANSFTIIMREYTGKAVADKAFARFKTFGHNVVLIPKDSANFKLGIPFTNPLIDTTRLKDSLQKIFGGQLYIDMK